MRRVVKPAPSDGDDLENPVASMAHFKATEMEVFKHKQEKLADSYEKLLCQHNKLLPKVIDAQR